MGLVAAFLLVMGNGAHAFDAPTELVDAIYEPCRKGQIQAPDELRNSISLL